MNRPLAGFGLPYWLDLPRPDFPRLEPLSPDDPLWRCPNTLLTQHTGGGYGEELLDKARFFLKNLELHRTGQSLLNLVDLQKGF